MDVGGRLLLILNYTLELLFQSLTALLEYLDLEG